MKKLLTLFLSILLLSCSDDPLPETKQKNAPSVVTVKNETIIGTGSFTSFQHNLSGRVILRKDTLSQSILRLDNFTMTQGPDVHVYFSKSNNYSNANVIEVIKLRDQYSNSTFDFNFKSTSYNEQYKFILVYCIEYNSLFGYAELR